MGKNPKHLQTYSRNLSLSSTGPLVLLAPTNPARRSVFSTKEEKGSAGGVDAGLRFPSRLPPASISTKPTSTTSTRSHVISKGWEFHHKPSRRLQPGWADQLLFACGLRLMGPMQKGFRLTLLLTLATSLQPTFVHVVSLSHHFVSS